MLREITAVRQDPEWTTKQWFRDDVLDLFVWRGSSGGIEKFQLACRDADTEHALTWTAAGGFLRHRVDDGEQRPDRHKATPILIPESRFPLELVAAAFHERAGRLDPGVRAFVAAKLEELQAAIPSSSRICRSDP